jgi:hypothetical protein
MKQKLLLFATVLLSTISFAQSQQMGFKDWSTNAGVQAMFQKNITKVDASGNVYTAGATLNANGKYDIFLTKVSSGGTVLYTKQINGTANDQDFALGLALNGTDVYMTGTIINNTVTLVPELFLVKYNSSGTQQFSVTYSGGYGDVGKDLIINPTYSACIVTGASYNSGFTSDMVVVSFNMNTGAQNWVNGYAYPYGANDAGIKIATKSNNCTVTSAVTAGANQYKLVTTSYTVSTGWGTGTLTAGATATSSVEIVSDLFQDASGNIFLCGATQQNAGQGYNIYVAKVTSSLTIAYETTINGFSGSSLDDFGKGITVDASGNAYISCVTTHSTQGKNLTVVKLNSSGAVQWTKNINNTSYNSNDAGADIAIDANNDVYVTGYQTVEANNTDIYVVKLANATGNTIWEVLESNDLNDEGTNIIMDNNDVLVAGSRETTPNNFEYVTYKYVQKDIQIPIEATTESPSVGYIFYENKGQTKNSSGTLESSVTHVTMDAYPGIFFKPKTFSYKLYNFDTLRTVADTTQRIDITLDGGSETAKCYSIEKTQGIVNIFDAKLPANVSEIQGYKRLVVPEIYTGVDAHYYSNKNGLKVYYVVKPGADPRAIKWAITGANTTTISGTNLVIQGINRKIIFDQPTFYQTNLAGTTTSTLAAGTWSNVGTGQYKFNVPTYNTALPLIIELDYGNTVSSTATSIANLEFCTYYGGARDEGFRTIKSSSINGRYIVAGTTTSWDVNRDFPILGPATSSVTTYYTYMTLVLFDSVGARVATNIYGGMSDIEPTDAIIHNNTGKVTVIGNMASATASLIPTNTVNLTPSTYTSTSGNGFAIQFDQITGGSLTKIRWQTKLNGYASNIALSPNYLSMYITTSTSLNTYTPDLLPKTDAYNNSIGSSGSWDFQISKFNYLGVRQWATYFPVGHSSAITSYTPTSDFKNYSQGLKSDPWMKCRIDCDNNGFVIAGEVKGVSLPYYNKYHKTMDSTFNGYSDGFVARFNSKDSLVFSQYIGGSGYDGFLGVKITNQNEIALVGFSGSSEYQDITRRSYSSEYIDTVASSNVKMLIAKLDSTGQKKWATYYGNGASASCLGWGITNDPSGSIYITGVTYGSFNIATTNASGLMNETAQLDLIGGTAGTGQSDGFMLAFNSSNILVWNTYFGGKYDDAGLALSYNSKKNRILITGITSTPRWEPCCVYHHIFPVCYPINFNPLSWIRDDINSSSALGPSLSYSNYDGYVGWWKTDKIAVGLQEYFKDKTNQDMFSLYPNPTSQESYIGFKNNLEGKVVIEIYSITGQLLYSDTKSNILNHAVITLPTYNFSNGVYVVTVKNNTNFMSKKLVINR